MPEHPPAVAELPNFSFATCQIGAERALKAEVARLWPAMHLAFSRPGFLTFKLPDAHRVRDDFDPHCVFARTWGFSLGRVHDPESARRAACAWNLADARPYEVLHVWQRDTATVGFRGFEPGPTELAGAAEATLRQYAPSAQPGSAKLASGVARGGQLVLDCIVVEPDEWWIGYHRADAGESRFPGGVRAIQPPADAVSRAYVKMQEALEVSGFPLRKGDRCVEIGCAPGGASQALLSRGLRVTGIDPATVDARVLEHPQFQHIRKRGADVPRREFRGVRWLAADMNVAPQYTLDTVEAIVTHPVTSFEGLWLTLKLLDWELAEEIPAYVERVGRWGFRHVRARQLAHNRQEICLMALRGSPGRPPAKRSSRRPNARRKRL